MDYYFGAGNRYIITPFSNSGRFRIDFLTLERPGRPEAMLEYHAAVEDDPDAVPDIEDYPYLSRFIRITDAAGGNHKIFNHQQADYFAHFNGFLSGHPGMVYDICLERCFELGDFSWLFKSEGIEYLQRATDLAKLYVETQELVRTKQQAAPKSSRKAVTKKTSTAESKTLN